MCDILFYEKKKKKITAENICMEKMILYAEDKMICDYLMKTLSNSFFSGHFHIKTKLQ